MKFLAFFFLILLVGCNSCRSVKTIDGEVKPAPAPVVAPAPKAQVEFHPSPAPAFKEESYGKSPYLKMAPPATDTAPPQVKRRARISNPEPPQTPVNVRHPDHFFSNVWGQVSITLGLPLAIETGTVQLTDKVPQAVAYTISLKGEPADQFEIKQGEQIVSAPNSKFPSSSVYFDVKPLAPGKKKLVYQAKARMSLEDPGIGLPEVSREIMVEVNKQSVMASLKKLLPYLLSFLGALGSALGGWMIKKWFDKKK